MGRSIFIQRFPGLFALLFALSLSACGGGGGGASGAPAPAVNHSPTISGVPPALIDTGATLDFQPRASDADGNRLSFTIANKPAWARFDSATGRLTGVPTDGDLGFSGDIVISVSDGALTVALPAFRIQVTGTAMLTWAAPTQNVDGTVLKDLTGYRIYYVDSGNPVVAVIRVTDPAQQSYRVGGLTAGTWYFAVTAVNSEGTESNLSNVGTKTLG